MSKNQKIVLEKDWLILINYLSDENRLKFYDLIFSFFEKENFDFTEVKDESLRLVLNFVSTKILQNNSKQKIIADKRKESGTLSAKARTNKRTKSTSVKCVEQNEQVLTKSTSVKCVEQNEQVLTKSTSVNICSKDEVVNDVVDEKLWLAWKEHLKKKRSPLTATRERLHLRKLRDLAETTKQTPESLVELAIERDWQSFFADRTQTFKNNKKFSEQNYEKGTNGFITIDDKNSF